MTAAPSISERMAAVLAGRDPARSAAGTLAKAQLCLTDFLSGAFEAAPLEWSRQAAAIATPLDTGPALIAGRCRAVPGDAAFANAVAAHGLVREDMHTGSVAHLGVVIWPALMAALVLTGRPVSGRAFLAAGIAGYEVGGRVGSALMNVGLARLLRPTGMVGPLASAAACGLLLGLDEGQLTAALGLAANTAAGLNEWPHSGGSEMYFHAGFAARNGLAATLLAREGAFAAQTIFEGEAGVFRALARTAPPDQIALFPGDSSEILSVFHKQAPACNYAQTPCQAALAALREFPGPSGDIAEVVVRCTHAALQYPGCDSAGPFRNVLQAKMSIQFGVAATLARGALGEANYARLDDPETARLMRQVRLIADDDLTAAYPARQGAEVTLSAHDGRRVTRRLNDTVKADAAEVGARFRRSAAAWLGNAQAGALDGFVETLADRPNVAALNAFCLPAG